MSQDTHEIVQITIFFGLVVLAFASVIGSDLHDFRAGIVYGVCGSITTIFTARCPLKDARARASL